MNLEKLTMEASNWLRKIIWNQRIERIGFPEEERKDQIVLLNGSCRKSKKFGSNKEALESYEKVLVAFQAAYEEIHPVPCGCDLSKNYISTSP